MFGVEVAKVNIMNYDGKVKRMGRNVGRTFALAIMTSVAFTAIAYFFNIILGKVGSFALLVLLVLQLGCAGGTYPLDLSPSIYRTMKPFFPFSYAVDGFRMTIATGQDITGIMLVLAGFAAVFIALSIIVTTVKVKSKNEKEYDDVMLIIIRSSLGIKRGLSIPNQTCVIDADYYNNINNEGHFWVCLKM